MDSNVLINYYESNPFFETLNFLKVGIVEPFTLHYCALIIASGL